MSLIIQYILYVYFCIYIICIFAFIEKNFRFNILKGRNIFNSLSRNIVIIKFGEKYYNYQNEL